MNVRKINFGVVGCGNVANNYYLPYIAKNHRLVAVCDVNPERAKRSAELWGADKFYNSPDELLSDKDVEAVIIVTSHDAHAPLALRAAEEGKHFIVQKPLALSIEEAENIVRKARKAGVKALAEPSEPLLSPMYREAKARLSDVGDVCFSIWHTGHAGPTWSEAFYDDSKGGGVIFDLAVYDVAGSLFLFGLPKTVRAVGSIKVKERLILTEEEATNAIRQDTYGKGVYYFHDLRPSVPIKVTAYDNVIGILEYNDGSLSSLHANYTTFIALQMPKAQIYGVEGVLTMGPGLKIFSKRGMETITVKEVKPYYHYSIDHLAECIENDEEPKPSLEWGLKVTRILLALDKSARTGRAVEI